MTGIKKVHHGVPADSLTRLKPQKLGRHYHKIPHYIRELSNKYPRIISDYFLRNYRINLELLKVDVHEQVQQEAECVYRSPFGKVGFSMDRSLLTEALECYYGGTCLPNHEAPPISTSEQRMRNRLGVDVTQLFARSILAGSTFGKLEPHDNAYDEAVWEYVAEFHFTSHITGSQASIFIYLDTQLVDELTSRLTSPPPSAPVGSSLNQIRQLPVRLDCVVASLQMPLSQVLALRPGDILSMRLTERCDVQINQQKLFRGVIFEEEGSLFLTSLESVKTP
ncbi:FliM/FliN family flagellar motor switch protein [Pseudomonas berkeleyensis]|uniref:FliM/FliN family flagellar motor switch protein n=1 Tax=Pseudomonas berkeleyensis TaxID=2726956 RepID=A0A7G5DNA2_9PSED|nr:FliM/FliN family flagellar motor switch protein [Pseudomonas berkeleyensis]QMV63227.1 FliM/FliN family flagellar motor switch protein [Pseudomonas berkeleyensis]WSO38683.1 FliM/FliN family flagellar motor switch protein [Pseudomonas berkeleyensis]